MMLNIVLGIVLGIIILPVLALNLFGPLLIKHLQKLPARIKLIAHDEHTFLLNREADFKRLDRSLRGFRFGYVGSSFMEDSHTKTHFSLYAHESEKTCAMIVSMVSKVKTITYIEFSQVYADGSMLDVSNANQVSVYPRADFKITVRYPEIQEPEKLYAAFKTVKKALKTSVQAIAYDNTTGFKMVEDFIAMESDHLVKKGYCKAAIDDKGKRSLTLKGAYLLTWKSIFPGNRLMHGLNASYGKKLLKRA